MTDCLKKQGYPRVETRRSGHLLRLMGLMAIYLNKDNKHFNGSNDFLSLLFHIMLEVELLIAIA